MNPRLNRHLPTKRKLQKLKEKKGSKGGKRKKRLRNGTQTQQPTTLPAELLRMRQKKILAEGELYTKDVKGTGVGG